MIGNVIEIGKNNVVVKISLKEDQIKSIINYHVAFDMDGGVVIGEIVSINKDTANNYTNSDYTTGTIQGSQSGGDTTT